MKFIAGLWAWVRSWFVRTAWPRRTVRVEELPERPDDDAVYLVGEGPHLWSAAMLCPCGCGELIQLNLLPPSRPLWIVDTDENDTVTLSPSVWRKAGCRSHFWLRRGAITWCDSRAN